VLNERRRAQRLFKRIPIRVLAGRASPRAEESAECLNISSSGVYFATRLKLQERTTVELRLQMPEEIFTGQPREWNFVARVVHVESLGRKFGVGAQFLYYSARSASTGSTADARREGM